MHTMHTIRYRIRYRITVRRDNKERQQERDNERETTRERQQGETTRRDNERETAMGEITMGVHTYSHHHHHRTNVRDGVCTLRILLVLWKLINKVMEDTQPPPALHNEGDAIGTRASAVANQEVADLHAPPARLVRPVPPETSLGIASSYLAVVVAVHAIVLHTA